MYLNQKIDFELAKILNNRIFADIYNDKYAAEDIKVTYDNYLCIRNYKEGEFIEDGDYDIYGKYYYAPTYAEIIDWLFNKGIVIEFIPCYTFALSDRIGYCFKVYKIGVDDKLLGVIFEQLNEFSSFQLAMKDIVTKLINEKYIN